MNQLVQQIDRHFAKLGTIGIQWDGSISRLAYSDEESAAMAYIRAEGEAFGLRGNYDPVGNLVLSLPGDHRRRLLLGSHLDSVPRGGNYDGAAGVVAGLEAIRRIAQDPVGGEIGVDLVVWRGEEYTFNAVYKGSATAFGRSEPHVLHNVYDGLSLRDAILRQGFDPSYIDEGRSSFAQDYIDGILGYLELHIEQGARLEQERKDLGIVTSIAGDRRYLVVLEGRFDHSGATPMGARYRSDVNLAMAYIQTRMDDLARRHLADGSEFTQTIGIINADPEIDRKYPNVHGNSVTKVSGIGYFTVDVMSADNEFMDDYSAELHRLIWRTGREFSVNAVIEQTDASPGISQLDPHLRSCLQEATTALDFSCLSLPSGAGHDAIMVAGSTRSDGTAIPTGMLFVPCKDGVSHAKEEYASHEDIAKGVKVLDRTLRKLLHDSA